MRTALREVPGPPPHRAFGAWGNLVRFSRDVVGHAGALFERYGPLVAVAGGDLERRPGLTRWVLIQGAELFREVVRRPADFHKPPLIKQLSPRDEALSPRQAALKRWGAGLFNANGETHREYRRILMPAFHRQRVEGYAGRITALAEEELRTWEPGTVRDVAAALSSLTLRIVSQALLGEPAGGGRDGSIGDLMDRVLRLAISPGVFLARVDAPGFPYRRMLDVVEEADRAVRGVIAARRASETGEDDLLSLLLQARHENGEPLTEEEIIEHAGVMFVAGREPTASALTWTLLLLALHPQVAADLLDELESVLDGGAPAADQLERLPFLDAVLRESMRLIAPVPINARVVARDTELGGYHLPAGTQMGISLFHTHRSPDTFDRPATFDPHRWEGSTPEPYAFSPFSAGPRTCIGAPFAMMELKVVLAMIAQRFRLELPAGARIDRAATITLGIKGGLRLRVHRQDRDFSRAAPEFAGNVREMIAL